MSDWTHAEELSGRKAFDVWRFTEAERAIPWDWADMADREKRLWIDRARKSARSAKGHGGSALSAGRNACAGVP